MRMSIRPMEEKDKACIMELMRVFYSSPAVLTNGSEMIFDADFRACVSDSPYLEGFVFENGGDVLGYAMVAKSFSTEFGKPCIWIEDLYVKEAHRGCGIGTSFLHFIEGKYPECVFRLEAEAENEMAIHVYEKHGFQVLPYLEMKK